MGYNSLLYILQSRAICLKKIDKTHKATLLFFNGVAILDNATIQKERLLLNRDESLIEIHTVADIHSALWRIQVNNIP